MKPVVCLENVSKKYGRGRVRVTALDKVDLMVNPGDFVVIQGPSGSGKTTLLNIIGGLEPPTQGRVLVENRRLDEMNQTQLSRLRRDRIGLVFQSFNLLPVLTVMENAEYILMLQGEPRKERRRKVSSLLGWMGLGGMESRFPRELSGGEQQRVAIARAVAAEPALVLADEPTASVDSETAEEILELMLRLNQESGVTFIFASHDQDVIKHARQHYRLKDGKII